MVVEYRGCDSVGAPRITTEEAEQRLARLGKSDKVTIKKWVGFNSKDNEVLCHCGKEYKTSGRNLIGTDKPHPFSGCGRCFEMNRPAPPKGGDWSGISSAWRTSIESLISVLRAANRSEGTVGQVRGHIKKFARRFIRIGVRSPSELVFEHVQAWYAEGPNGAEKSHMWKLLFQEGHGEFVVMLNGRVPKVYWEELENRRRTLVRMASEMNPPWTNQEDWLDLKKEMIPHSKLADYYSQSQEGGSSFDCVHDVFEDWAYRPWDFTHGPGPGHWQSKSNRLDALRHIEEVMGWTEPTDWYNLKQEHYDSINGRLLGYYSKIDCGGTIVGAVTDIYPELLCEPWRFDRCPIDWVNALGELNIELAKRWVEYVMQELGFADVTELLSVLKKKHFEDKQYNGYGLYNALDGAKRIPNLLIRTHPEHEEVWQRWEISPDSPLKNIEERKRRMSCIARNFNIKQPDHWYSVGPSMAHSVEHGSGLIAHFGGWIPALEEYTGQQFYPWLFDGGLGRWTDELVNEWREWVAIKHGLPGADEISDENESKWVILNRDFLTSNGGASLRKRFGNMWLILVGLFPDHEFSNKFHDEYHERRTSALELAMKSAIRRLLELEDTDERLKITRKDCTMNRENLESMNIDSDGLKFSPTDTAVAAGRSGAIMNVDCLLPMIKLAFEAQGQQHYGYNTKFHNTVQDYRNQKRRDREKASASDGVGITLVTVPYWWDYTANGLAMYIHKQTGKSVDQWKRMLEESRN